MTWEAPWSPELQEEVTRKWNALFAGFAGGDPEIQQGLNKTWSDQQNWPSPERVRYAIKPEIQEFVMKAMKAR